MVDSQLDDLAKIRKIRPGRTNTEYALSTNKGVKFISFYRDMFELEK